MGRKRKVGRPKTKGGKGCHKQVCYRKRKGRVTKVKGYPKKSCLTKK